MALGSFVAGRYVSSYDPPGATAAADVGIQEEGYEVQVAHSEELIQNTDAFGDMVIDGIWRGLNTHIQATAVEWKQGVLNALFPYQQLLSSGVSFLGPGIIGRRASDVAGILVLTATAGTPAAASPASLTATLCKIAENFDLRWLLGTRHRKIPFRWRLLPYDDAGTIKIFTVT